MRPPIPMDHHSTTATPARGSDLEEAGSAPQSETASDEVVAAIASHSGSIYRVAVSIVRDHALAEDVVQETLIRAWWAYPSFRGDSPLRPWLLRIAHNTAISLLRTRRDEPVDPWRLSDDAPVVSDRMLSGPLLDDFRSALDELDSLSRAVVVMREIEDETYDAIAEMLEVPISTVKTRLFRARRRLAAAMEGWEA